MKQMMTKLLTDKSSRKEESVKKVSNYTGSFLPWM